MVANHPAVVRGGVLVGRPRDIDDSVDEREAGTLIFFAGDESRGCAAVSGAWIGGGDRDRAGKLLVPGQRSIAWRR